MNAFFVWTVGDVIGAVIFFSIVAVGIFAWLGITIRQRICQHDSGIYETRSCDAICCKCGKNLGFIGDWRKK